MPLCGRDIGYPLICALWFEYDHRIVEIVRFGRLSTPVHLRPRAVTNWKSHFGVCCMQLSKVFSAHTRTQPCMITITTYHFSIAAGLLDRPPWPQSVKLICAGCHGNQTVSLLHVAAMYASPCTALFSITVVVTPTVIDNGCKTVHCT